MTTCGEAMMRLLAEYGVTTVFGVPGVHTLEFCRALSDTPWQGHIRHVQARNEQGAGFMADGWARTTGEVGVMLVISGPGVTNGVTALGQGYADSVPILMISAEPASPSLGKGWGTLHELTEQKKTTEPVTALSVTVRAPEEVPVYLAQAFALMRSGRPRPTHVSVPIDVLEMTVDADWRPVAPPPPPAPRAEDIAAAARLLAGAARPLIVTGGGAVGAAAEITALAERLGAVVAASAQGKGVVADDHPLSVSGALGQQAFHDYLAEPDAILAIGSEMAPTNFVRDRAAFTAKLVRVDIDPKKIGDQYEAAVGIVADAKLAAAALLAALGPGAPARGEARAAALRAAMRAGLSPSERHHARLLTTLRAAAPPETAFAADACQQAYTGEFLFPLPAPRLWHYPAGFCTLGGALPAAIGAKLARPDRPAAVLAGDGGFMFTCQELIVGAELGLGVAIVLWDNQGLKQIRDDMEARGIPPVGVDGIQPDFELLAGAMRCAYARPESARGFADAVRAALAADRPTIIHVKEADAWLQDDAAAA